MGDAAFQSQRRGLRGLDRHNNIPDPRRRRLWQLQDRTSHLLASVAEEDAASGSARSPCLCSWVRASTQPTHGARRTSTRHTEARKGKSAMPNPGRGNTHASWKTRPPDAIVHAATLPAGIGVDVSPCGDQVGLCCGASSGRTVARRGTGTASPCRAMGLPTEVPSLQRFESQLCFRSLALSKTIHMHAHMYLHTYISIPP